MRTVRTTRRGYTGTSLRRSRAERWHRLASECATPVALVRTPRTAVRQADRPAVQRPNEISLATDLQHRIRRCEMRYRLQIAETLLDTLKLAENPPRTMTIWTMTRPCYKTSRPTGMSTVSTKASTSQSLPAYRSPEPVLPRSQITPSNATRP